MTEKAKKAKKNQPKHCFLQGFSCFFFAFLAFLAFWGEFPWGGELGVPDLGIPGPAAGRPACRSADRPAGRSQIPDPGILRYW